jgi:hypothetical protein
LSIVLPFFSEPSTFCLFKTGEGDEQAGQAEQYETEEDKEISFLPFTSVKHKKHEE